MKDMLLPVLFIVLTVLLLAGEIVFARLRKQGRPRNGLEALMFLAFFGCAAAVIAVSTAQTAVWRKGSLDKARQNPRVRQVLEEMTLRAEPGDYTGQTDAEGNGIRNIYYEIVTRSGESNGVRAQRPCMILELGVDGEGKPFVAGVTRVGRAEGEKWPDEADPEGFRTLCFWLRSEPSKVDYWTEGGVREVSVQERANAYLYDVESGCFFWDHTVYADSLGEKTTNVRNTRLKPKHFEEFVENMMEHDG